MSERVSQASLATSKAPLVTTSVDHPRLLRTDAESIRVFLRSYDHYCHEVVARAQQIARSEMVTTESVRPINLKYCVDPEYLESAISLGFLQGVEDYESLSDKTLREYLDHKARQSKDATTLESLDKLVSNELRMDMTDLDARSRMECLFVAYPSLLRRNGVAWVIQNNQKAAVSHVLSAVRPISLQNRLRADLDFAHYDSRKDFRKFMAHALRLSDAFQMLDNGPNRGEKFDNRYGEQSRGKFSKLSERQSPGIDKSKTSMEKHHGSSRSEPPCPFRTCKAKGAKHLIKKCPEATEEEKRSMLAALAAEKASDGPSRSTRSQTSARPTAGRDKITGTAGRITDAVKIIDHASAPSCDITVSDGDATLSTIGRCDDGADDSIVAPQLAETAVIKGIGKITSIEPVWLQVALKNGDKPQKFSFSRTWSVPSTVLQLSSGKLALVNITFLVADDGLTDEDLLIGLPVLEHLKVDTRTMLERNCRDLDGMDCSQVGNPTRASPGGSVSRLMIARLNGYQSHKSIHRVRVPADRPRVNYHTARTEEDPFVDPSLLDPLDNDQHQEIREAVEGLKQTIRNNGILAEDATAIDEVIEEHIDVFRTSFSSGPPAKVRPLRIELTPDARPVKVRLRNYSEGQREFLSDMVAKLVRNGMAFPNPTSAWACAPLLVPKPGPARFRFTVDLRPVNKFTVKHQYPMPNLDHELTKLGGSRYFATFDLSHGYWQFELEPESRSLQSFITLDGIYSPTRVLHGTTNAVTHLQSSLAEIIPNDLKDNILRWLDDILLHDRTVKGLLQAIRTFLGVCVEWNIKLHPAKCVFFARSVRWCGRLVSSKGIRYDPKRMDGLLKMVPPTTGGHLQQFLCALQWTKNGIPNFSALVASLHEFMERVYNQAGKRTKRAVSRVQLQPLGWGSEEDKAFQVCKDALAHQVTLAHRDKTKRLCVYTDASDTVWSGIVTQVPLVDLSKPYEAQRHEPLGFLSGRFTKTEFGWSILEKEAYAVLATLHRMHWLVATPDGFDLFTDHNKLIFLFDTLSIVSDLSQTSLRKVLRWAVRLSMYNYTCYHIKGEENVWADLLGRWSAPNTVRRIVQIPELPSSSDPEFIWPDLREIEAIQRDNKINQPEGLKAVDRVFYTDNGAIWIPNSSTDLQLRLCIIAHTGPAGHRGRASTEMVLKKSYFWSTLSTDVENFVRACIHCLSTVGGEKMPRPFGPAVHGSSPNALLQFDYIEIGPSTDGDKYVLMLRDDHSGYQWFFPFATTAVENAANAIIDWCAAFGVPQGLMSDGPTHFRNETMLLIAKGLRVPHHFTLPYTPWSNGAVERLGKELVRALRATVSEFQMRYEEWPNLLPLIQSALNNAPSTARDNIAPITAFLGKEPTPAISTFIRTAMVELMSVKDLQWERCINVRALQDRMDELHPLVQGALQSHRDNSRRAASKGRLPNFTEGDFVLVAQDSYKAGEKLALRWRGPRRVIKARSEFVYQVEDLRNGAREDIHVTRLKFYRDSSLNTEAIMSHVLSSESGMVVSRVMRLVESDDGLHVVVRWKGLPPSEDSMEPLGRIYEDVPQMVLRLIYRKSTAWDLADKARAALSL